jgi:HSP20 family protein
MTFGDLVPWGRGDRSNRLQRREPEWPGSSELSPFLKLHTEMNRLFEDAFRGFDAPSVWGGAWPSMEVKETDKGYRVSVELPGMDEKDVDVSYADGVLIVRGEKREETEDRDRKVTERRYGRFERRLALPDADQAGASATFDRGLLTIELPRSAQAEERVKRIPINPAETKH